MDEYLLDHTRTLLGCLPIPRLDISPHDFYGLSFWIYQAHKLSTIHLSPEKIWSRDIVEVLFTIYDYRTSPELFAHIFSKCDHISNIYLIIKYDETDTEDSYDLIVTGINKSETYDTRRVLISDEWKNCGRPIDFGFIEEERYSARRYEYVRFKLWRSP